ncbi:ATP-binding protein [Alkalihalobacterium bogoriense]|uniref:ATP-binding protein n=1 Tax=Alkalihalobacterium bogoriense TaxID=246272 RepID=UPI00047DD59A|nr:ATP-binding protein [Alkalihalobacterium bogoriense]
MFQRFFTLSFRNKILFSFLLLVCLLSGVSLLFVHTIDNVGGLSDGIEQEAIPEFVWIKELQEEAFIRRYALEQFLLREERDLLEYYFHNEITTALEQTDLPSSLKEIDTAFAELNFIYLNKVEGLLKYNNIPVAKQVIEDELLPRLLIIEQELNTLENDTIYSITTNSNNISMMIKQSLIFLLVSTCIAIILSIILAYRISQDLTKPMEKLLDQVESISKGQYGLEVDVVEQYDLHKLTTSINKMSISLEESFTTLIKEKLVREQILSSLPIGIISVEGNEEDIQINDMATVVIERQKEEIKRLIKSKGAFPDNLEFWNWFFSKEYFQTRKTTFTTRHAKKKLLVSQTALINETENVIGRIFHFIDISEIDKLEERIHRSEKLALLGEVAAGAAHEIRNPLAVIHGFINMMNDSISNENRTKYHLPLLLKELERINQIVGNLLLLVKPGKPNFRPFELKEVLDDILPIIKGTCPSGITIDLKIDSYKIFIDYDQMKQVFYNLIRNSIQAIGLHGQISIYSEKAPHNMIYIYIKDSGPGIDPEIHEQIFEPFISSKEDGTGLGLTIIQRIITNHYGKIDLIESTNNGTTFRLTLPLHEK